MAVKSDGLLFSPFKIGCVLFCIAFLIMGCLAVLEITWPAKESVSGFMLLAMYAQLPWIRLPGYVRVLSSIFDWSFNLTGSSELEYVIGILISSLCWFWNGVVIGFFLKFILTITANDRNDRTASGGEG
jgi:hypothetical protein